MELFKKYRPFVVWGLGILFVYFIYDGAHRPTFIKENEIVVHQDLEILLILYVCSRLASNKKIFHDEGQDNWAKDVECRLASIEKRLR